MNFSLVDWRYANCPTEQLGKRLRARTPYSSNTIHLQSFNAAKRLPIHRCGKNTPDLSIASNHCSRSTVDALVYSECKAHPLSTVNQAKTRIENCGHSCDRSNVTYKFARKGSSLDILQTARYAFDEGGKGD